MDELNDMIKQLNMLQTYDMIKPLYMVQTYQINPRKAFKNCYNGDSELHCINRK